LNGSLEVRFRFKTFKVYQDSKKYCKSCRDIVEKQIKKKDSNLASQINGALNSIILNIAEGSADHSDSEFARFLGIAIRSVYETVAGFDLALLYGLVTEEQNEGIESAAHDLVKQLSGFRNSLKEK
jgi:four helix bundle protein